MSVEFYRVTNGRNTLLATPFEDKSICVPFAGTSQPLEFDEDTNWASYCTIPVSAYTDKGHSLVNVTPKPAPAEPSTANAVFTDEDGTYWVLCGQTGEFYGFSMGAMEAATNYLEIDFVKETVYLTGSPNYPLRRIA